MKTLHIIFSLLNMFVNVTNLQSNAFLHELSFETL